MSLTLKAKEDKSDLFYKNVVALSKKVTKSDEMIDKEKSKHATVENG